MTNKELREILLGYPDNCPVRFFNRDETEGSPFYEIKTAEYTQVNNETIMSCVLTDDPEGVTQR